MENGFLTGRTVTRNMCEGKNNPPVSLYKYPILKHVYIAYHMSLAVLLSDCIAHQQNILLFSTIKKN